MAATKHATDIKKDTKDCIATAMIQLLMKEKLQSLTVSRVCERAGVSRMAFYRNYDGLEQIIYEYYKQKIADVFKTIRDNAKYSVKFESQLEFFNAFGDFLILSNERGYEPVIQRIFTEEMELMYVDGNAEGETDEYLTAFMSAGAYAVWKKWLLDGRRKPLGDIMKLMKRVNE